MASTNRGHEAPPAPTEAPDTVALKVCMVGYCESPSSIPPMYNGGVSLASSGFAVESVCFTSRGSSVSTVEHAPGFRTRRFRMRVRELFQARFGPAPANLALGATQYILSYAEYLIKGLAHAIRSKADLYEAHDLPALLPALVAGTVRRKPVVYHAHELWSETHAKVRFARAWRLMDRLLVPLCEQVVTPDESRSQIYRDEFGSRQMPLTVRNCPPYEPPRHSTKLREALGRRGIAFETIVLYQGLVDSPRCIEEMADASRYFDDGVVLVIVGGGFGKWADPGAVLQEYGRVAVFPRVAYEDLPSYTASADVGMLLYRNDCRNNYYCAPNKLFEYMMMGLPVIAANFPGMVKIVEGEGVGLCVRPDRPREIAAAVNKLGRDREGHARMKANGLRLSRDRYNWEFEFRPLLERYRSLLDGTAQR